MKRAGIAGAIASAVALIGTALPAQAATTPGWRQVYTHHFGASTSASVLTSVVATGKTTAWAVGGEYVSSSSGTVDKPLIVGTTDGKHWNAATLPSGLTGIFYSVSAPAANDIWAVTIDSGELVHYDGHHWTLAHHFSGNGELTGVTALSSNNVWVFGGGGANPGLGTWHYDGAHWTESKTGYAVGLEYASALSAKDIWAIGGTQAPESAVERYNGAKWLPVSTKGLPAGQWQFSGIRAVSDTDVWAIATLYTNNSNVPYLLGYNGSSWKTYKLPWSVTSGNSSDILSLASDGAGGMWFTNGTVQNGPGNDFTSTFYLVHRTAGGAWTRQKTGETKFTTTMSESGTSLHGLALIPGTKSLWAAGFDLSTTTGASTSIWADGNV